MNEKRGSRSNRHPDFVSQLESIAAFERHFVEQEPRNPEQPILIGPSQAPRKRHVPVENAEPCRWRWRCRQLELEPFRRVFQQLLATASQDVPDAHAVA